MLWQACVVVANTLAAPYLPTSPDTAGPEWLPEAVALLAAALHHHATAAGLSGDQLDALDQGEVLATLSSAHEARAALHAAPADAIADQERAYGLTAPLAQFDEMRTTATALLSPPRPSGAS